MVQRRRFGLRTLAFSLMVQTMAWSTASAWQPHPESDLPSGGQPSLPPCEPTEAAPAPESDETAEGSGPSSEAAEGSADAEMANESSAAPPRQGWRYPRFEKDWVMRLGALSPEERAEFDARRIVLTPDGRGFRVAHGASGDPLAALDFVRAVGDVAMYEEMQRRNRRRNREFRWVFAGGLTLAGGIAGLVLYEALGPRESWSSQPLADGYGEDFVMATLVVAGATLAIVPPVWVWSNRRARAADHWYDVDAAAEAIREHEVRLLRELELRAPADSDGSAAPAPDVSEASDRDAALQRSGSRWLAAPARPPVELRLGLAGAGVGATLTF